MRWASLLGFCVTCLACSSDDGDDSASGGSAGAGGSTNSGGGAGKASGGSGGTPGSGGSAVAGSGGADSGGSAGSGGGSSGSPSGGTAGTGGGSGECCVDQSLTWGPDGGFVAYVERSTLTPCQRYSRERSPLQTDPPSDRCAQDLGGCDAAVTGTAVANALAHPDVTTAVAAAPVLYGCDTRPVDGQVLQIDLGTARIEVGRDGCGQIPEGVAALAALLRALEAEQLEREQCASVFPD
jgi:hypothetical protein